MGVWLLSKWLLVNEIILFGGYDVLILGFKVALQKMQAER